MTRPLSNRTVMSSPTIRGGGLSSSIIRRGGLSSSTIRRGGLSSSTIRRGGLSSSTIRREGFTLIELLLVVGVTVILMSVSLPIYSDWHMNAEVTEAASKITGALRLAREQAAAGIADSGYGLSLGADRYSLFQVFPDDSVEVVREEVFPASLSLSSDLPGGEVRFARSTGAPSSAGTISLAWQNQGRTIEINSLGLIGQQ